ncbi:efflux RND transporter periplasmic adaptor subunit [Oryzibacter oryziterrae]|uniref:efflux RND transporter periplasmic adaptor subunit n=1 Tax=Oryzibacter oryziterrae TaxID=2766474 RepID=UPI001F004CD7|nr:efflux RND transporter periplasmic adaptor subunit [Oryzibacter oryziterrae]
MSSPAKRSRGGKTVVYLLLILLLAGGGYWVKTSYFGKAAPTYMTSVVGKGNVEVTVLASGTLRPVKLVAVGAQVSGRITKVPVGLGDSVKAGDPIAEIDSVTQQNALRTAQASLANIEAQRDEKQATLTLAEQTLARQQAVLAQNAISHADFETAEAQVKTTKAQIAALEAQIKSAQVAVDTAKVNLGYTRITAPIDGTVLAIVSQQGQTVNAAQSAPTIVILGQLDQMTVQAEISEADVVRVAPGQKVYFSIVGDPDRRYDATLQSIDPAPENIKSDSSFSTSSSSSSSSSSSTAVYYNGNFNVPNPDGRLRTYMTAEVHIVLGSAQDVLTVPYAALGERDKDGRYKVRLLAAEGRVTEAWVSIGLTDKITAQVTDGLSEGDRVITGERAAGAAASSVRLGGPPGGL